MKNFIVSVSLLSFLLLAHQSYSQENAQAPDSAAASAVQEAPAALQVPTVSAAPPPQPPFDIQNSVLWQGYLAAFSDLDPISNPGRNIKTTIEQLDKFEFSPETKKKLFDLFGKENPLHLKSKKLGNGNTELLIEVESLDYQNPKTLSKIHSSELTGKVTYNKLYNRSHAFAAMPSFSFDDGKTIKVTANDFSYASEQTLGAYGLWLGTGTFKLDHFAIDDSTSDLHVKVDGTSIKSDIKQHGKLLNIGFDYVVKSINWGKDGLGPVHLAASLVNIDEKEFAALSEKSKALNKTQQTNEERLAATTGIIKDFGLATLKHGGAVDIQDFSVQYHGKTARLNGHIGFDKIEKSDWESIKTIGNKITAKFNLHLPTSLVTDISRVFARSNLEAQNKKNGQAVTDKAVDEKAQEMASNIIGKMVTNKWIQIKNDTIFSTIELKEGKLFANGQPVSSSQDSSAQANPKINNLSQKDADTIGNANSTAVQVRKVETIALDTQKKLVMKTILYVRDTENEGKLDSQIIGAETRVYNPDTVQITHVSIVGLAAYPIEVNGAYIIAAPGAKNVFLKGNNNNITNGGDRILPPSVRLSQDSGVQANSKINNLSQKDADTIGYKFPANSTTVQVRKVETNALDTQKRLVMKTILYVHDTESEGNLVSQIIGTETRVYNPDTAQVTHVSVVGIAAYPIEVNGAYVIAAPGAKNVLLKGDNNKITLGGDIIPPPPTFTETTLVPIPGKNYELGKFDVTRGEFAKFVNETGYDAGNACDVWTGSVWENRSGTDWRNPGFSQDDTDPVTCVNWNDAQAYVTWLSKKASKQYRLPNEEEWEYACYGGSKTEYCGGSDLNSVAWYRDNSNGTTHPVGLKQANGYGLYDMSGNVWQWMENKYDNEHDWLVRRGGGWGGAASDLSTARRGFRGVNGGLDDRGNTSGFRLARTLP